VNIKCHTASALMQVPCCTACVLAPYMQYNERCLSAQTAPLCPPAVKDSLPDPPPTAQLTTLSARTCPSAHMR
jgi:hypothetical protein